MKKTFLITSILALLMLSCNQTQKDNTATITGKIENLKANEVKFKWIKNNSADIKPITHIAKLDSSNSFEISIPLQQLSSGVMLINEDRYDIVLQPGDKLNVVVSDDTIVFSGKACEKNNFLYLLSKNDKCSKMNLMMSWYTEKHELKEFFSMLNNYIEIRKQEFEKFKSKHNLQKEFIEYFNIDTYIDEIDLYNQVAKVYSRKNKLPIDSIQIPIEFQKHLSLKDIQNDKYLIAGNYLDIINAYINKYTMQIMASTPNLRGDSVKLSVAMDSLSGKTLEHYLTQNIYYKLSIYDNYDSLLIACFDKVKKDKNCIATVENVMERYNKRQAMIGAELHSDFLQTALYDTANNATTMAEVLKKCKNKVVYIDIWSLGCGPCIQAMPFSNEIKENLKDYPVDFIYLCVDNYSDNLWNKVFKHAMTKTNHYRLAKGFDSKVTKMFDIMAIPTYIIIDKNAKLVSYHAQRPFNNSWKKNTELEKELMDLALAK